MSGLHQVLVITKNSAGIGSRILGLFHRRGFSVVQMTSGVTLNPAYARITLTVEADAPLLDQIQKQIYKIVDVVKVKVFPVEGVVRRELMLVKVGLDAGDLGFILELAQVFRAHVLDVSDESLIVEVIGEGTKLQGFLEALKGKRILEIARTGTTAMSRGSRL